MCYIYLTLSKLRISEIYGHLWPLVGCFDILPITNTSFHQVGIGICAHFFTNKLSHQPYEVTPNQGNPTADDMD